jgi:outer membrane lipoprotein-sorting protein
MKRFWAAAVGIGLALGALSPSVARADEAGDKALSAIDGAVYKAKTQILEYEATIKTPEKADRSLKIGIWMKDSRRFTEFLAPADMKGTKVLILAPDQMYVYLPAYKKVRRIASHVTDQGFMGMNFTQDDMSISSYAKMFTATIAGDDGKTQKLVLTAKPSTGAPYAKVEMTVEKARNLPTEMKYFSESGAHVKTETRAEYTCENGFCAPGVLKMVDHTKGGQSTSLARKVWKVNVEISDDRFSKRKLEEG